MSGEDVKKMPRVELMELAEVKDALDQADAQLVAYREALAERQGVAQKLRGYAVVALGFARLVVRPLPPLPSKSSDEEGMSQVNNFLRSNLARSGADQEAQPDLRPTGRSDG